MLIQLPPNTSSIEITPLADSSGATIRITLRDANEMLPIQVPLLTEKGAPRRKSLRPYTGTLVIVSLALVAVLAGHVMSARPSNGAAQAAYPRLESPNTEEPPIQRHVVQTGPTAPDAFGLN